MSLANFCGCSDSRKYDHKTKTHAKTKLTIHYATFVWLNEMNISTKNINGSNQQRTAFLPFECLKNGTTAQLELKLSVGAECCNTLSPQF